MSFEITPASPPVWTACAGPAAGAPLALGTVDLWLIDLDAGPATTFDFLVPEERARAARLFHHRHSCRYAAGRNALRWLLGAYLDLPPQAIAFTYGPMGKPALDVPGRDDLAFNLTHSDRYAILAVGEVAALGIDIEAVRPLSYMLEVAESKFAPAEMRALLDLPPERQLDGFLACWTSKEAIVKLWGDGLSADLSSFEVVVDPDSPANLLTLDRPGVAVGDITLWGFRPALGYRATLAAPGSASPPRFWRLTD